MARVAAIKTVQYSALREIKVMGMDRKAKLYEMEKEGKSGPYHEVR